MHATDLIVIGLRDALAAFKARAVGHPPPYADSNPPRPDRRPLALSFHALVPVPADVRDKPYLAIDGSGWDWESEHWGCTFGAWNISSSDLSTDRIIYQFFANRPPIEFVLWASASSPDLQFRLTCVEEDDEYGSLLIERGSIVSLAW